MVIKIFSIFVIVIFLAIYFASITNAYIIGTPPQGGGNISNIVSNVSDIIPHPSIVPIIGKLQNTTFVNIVQYEMIYNKLYL